MLVGVVLLAWTWSMYRNAWYSKDRAGFVYWSNVIVPAFFGASCLIAGISRLF